MRIFTLDPWADPHPAAPSRDRSELAIGEFESCIVHRIRVIARPLWPLAATVFAEGFYGLDAEALRDAATATDS